jgi:peptidoglycan/LPS O-acetylase OafA/YrhL
LTLDLRDQFGGRAAAAAPAAARADAAVAAPVHPKYRPDIDGLRAVAVLSVVAFHAFPEAVRGGYIGVDVFFVISGFLISTILFENLARGSFSLAGFYARRVRRIFPALATVLLACLGFGWLVLLPDELNQLGQHLAAGAGFVSNLVLWREAGYFDASAETKPLLHLWSLGIEEQFYIAWPVLLWAAWRLKLSLPVLAVVAGLASFALNVAGVRADPVATFYSPLTWVWELLCGAGLAWWWLQRPKPSQALSPPARVLPELRAAGGIALLAAGFWVLDKDARFPGWWATVPVLGAVLVISAGPQAWINRRILSHRIPVWFGLISFPLYLWHWPILAFGRIVHFDVPPARFRVAAVLASVLLAWLTVRFIEKPLRFGDRRAGPTVAALCGLVLAVGLAGLAIARTDFSGTRGFDTLVIPRKGEHAIGASLAWFRGKDDWLFLGNAHDRAVAKLKGAVEPDPRQVRATVDAFARLSEAAHRQGVRVALLVGPDKPSVHPEYLPDGLVPSPRRHLATALQALEAVPHLTVHDPTEELRALTATEGLLYWRTDTHWNDKGAFLAYAGLARRLALPVPPVRFTPGPPRGGDLIGLSKQQAFPVRAGDHWEAVWPQPPAWTETVVPNEKKTAFGAVTVVANPQAPSDQTAWVVGDSYTAGLKPYFNASFREVRYVGHWIEKLKELPADLAAAERKPDLVVVVRVERSF